MSDLPAMPRPEDFGLDADAVERTPGLLVAPRRGVLCVGVLVSLLFAAIGGITWWSGSAASGFFLGPLLIGASLILLVPLVMGCLCAASALEECWRSARNPGFRACLQYRRAVEEFNRKTAGRQYQRSMVRWRFLGRDRLCERVAALFAAGGPVEALDRHETGADLIIRRGDRATVVRCEEGPRPAQAGAGRELAMAQMDLGAHDAILVAPGGFLEALRQTAEKHAIRLVDDAGLMKNSEF